MSQVNFYSKDSLSDIPWDLLQEELPVKSYLLPLLEKGTGHYFGNISAKVGMLSYGKYLLPFIENKGDMINSFIASPSTHYYTYPKDQIHLFKNRIVKWTLPFIYRQREKLAEKLEIDKVIQLNNWLLTTNLSPQFDEVGLKVIREALIGRFPDRAITISNVDLFRSSLNFDLLKSLGFRLIPLRPIYTLDASDPKSFGSRMEKKDLKLLKESSYEVVQGEDLSSEDLKRVSELYWEINVLKHSYHNPQCLIPYFKAFTNSPNLSLIALRKEGRIDAFVCCSRQGETLISLSVGYDISISEDVGLYRQVMAALFEKARNLGGYLHLSSGAGSFKKLRRGKKSIDYLAVYDKHLPFYRRLIWSELQFVMEKFGKPVFLKKDI